MIGRLRKRFIRIAVLSVALVLLLLTVIVNLANYFSVNSDVDKLLSMITDERGGFGELLSSGEGGDFRGKGGGPGGQNERMQFDGRRFNSETPFSTRYFELIFTSDGELVSSDLTHIASVDESDTAEYLAAAFRHGEGKAYYSGYKYNVERLSEGTYRAVFIDCFTQQRSVRTVLFMTLAADVFCLALVYVLVVFFSKKAIDPVVRSAQRQKQFITDAGHELKTPLTVMTTSLKVLEMEVGKSKWIDKAEAQTKKMTELVNSLVTLSRMDEEEPPITLMDFDLSSAVSETAESFRDSALARGHELRTEIPEGIIYHGDEAAVRQLVSILIDNAVKYSLPEGEISLSVRKEHRGVVIRQSNPCEAIGEKDLEKLFDRFYRADSSRSSEKSGFGVGLSIARGIAEAHRGSISAHCPQEGVIEFTAVLK